jgi:hypothetical protein
LPESLVDMLLLMQVDTTCVIPSLISLANPPEIANVSQRKKKKKNVNFCLQLAEAIVTVYLHENGVHLDRLLKHCVTSCVNEVSKQTKTKPLFSPLFSRLLLSPRLCFAALRWKQKYFLTICIATAPSFCARVFCLFFRGSASTTTRSRYFCLSS